MLTAQEISEAKRRVRYENERAALHEHDDCIRIAYEWLDAQTKTRGPIGRTLPIKHMIEKWGGRYVSQSDVEVAAELHPEIEGRYPHFNISARLVLPSDARLANIPEARTQGYVLTEEHVRNVYANRQE
jgi:hypothetical protein